MSNNRLPLYIQISEDLKFKINSGEWNVNDQIPTEYELCSIYDVSRITIRKAIDQLVNVGLLDRKRAIGTFVKEHHSEEKDISVKSFTQEMIDLGRNVHTLNATIEKKPASIKIANFLGINEGEDVLNLQRIFGSDNRPFAFFDTYFTFKEFFSLDSNDYYESFYEYLKEYDIIGDSFKEYVEAIKSDKRLMSLLPIKEDTPILKRVRIVGHSKKNFNEYSECFYIGSEYRYYVET